MFYNASRPNQYLLIRQVAPIAWGNRPSRRQITQQVLHWATQEVKMPDITPICEFCHSRPAVYNIAIQREEGGNITTSVFWPIGGTPAPIFHSNPLHFYVTRHLVCEPCKAKADQHRREEEIKQGCVMIAFIIIFVPFAIWFLKTFLFNR
jgi:hypothetical protein